MSAEQHARFTRLPVELREAYVDWFMQRKERRAAHRDTLEAFTAGWQRARRSIRQRRMRSRVVAGAPQA
jgi:hypothetical protein